MSQAGQFTTLSGAISTLTGDLGGAVSPTLANIDILGGNGIVVTGTPGSSLLTIAMGTDVATTFTSDTGTATPATNNLDVLGGANIATTGATDTLTIAVSGTTDNAVQIGNATGSLDSIAVGTTGQVLSGLTAGSPSFSDLGNNSGLTAHGVVISEGNSAFVATPAGTNGMVLIASTGSDPSFGLLTSTGSTLAFTTGAGTLNLETGATVPVSFTTDSGSAVPAAGVLSILGGTNINTGGATSIATVNLDAAITIDSMATSPTDAGLTIATTDIAADGTDTHIGITITPKGDGILDVSTDVQADGFVTSNLAAGLEITDNSIGAEGTDANIDIDLVAKGTGEITISYATANAITVYSATSGLDEIGPLTDGQIVIGSTAAAPVAATLTSSGGTIAFTLGAGTLNLEASGGGLDWSAETGTTIAMAEDTGYIIDNASLNTATLPATSAVGAVYRLVGKGTGGWLLAQNAGQAVNMGTAVTTTGAGGSLASSDDGDCIELVCITTDTTFRVISSIGNITVV